MSGSQYWTSLWGVGLIIFLFFFILFLGLAFFTFLYDRISVFEIWNSPVWLKTKAPLIIICVIGFLAAMITYINYEGRKELRAAREYAQNQGWSFSLNDTQGLKAGVAFWRGLPRMLKKRQAVMARAKIHPREVGKWFV